MIYIRNISTVKLSNTHVYSPSEWNYTFSNNRVLVYPNKLSIRENLKSIRSNSRKLTRQLDIRRGFKKEGLLKRQHTLVPTRRGDFIKAQAVKCVFCSSRVRPSFPLSSCQHPLQTQYWMDSYTSNYKFLDKQRKSMEILVRLTISMSPQPQKSLDHAIKEPLRRGKKAGLIHQHSDRLTY